MPWQTSIYGRKRQSRIGQRFGRLTIVADAPDGKGFHRRFECRCDCGTTKIIEWSCLQCGTTLSCGCLQKEMAGRMNTRHGFAGAGSAKAHPLYNKWHAIKSRCFNPKHIAFKFYGARGITMAKEWKDDPEAFISWGLANGWRPGLEIDRVNRRGNYEPSNCEFISKSENVKRKLDDERCERQLLFVVSSLSLPG